MKWPDDQVHDVLAPGFADQIVVFNRTFDQRDLDFVSYHQVRDVARVGGDDVQIDPRIGPVEDAEIFGDHVGRDRGARADAERSAIETAQRAKLVFGGAFGREQGFRVPGQRLSFPRRPHAFAGAVEQTASHLQFEIPYPLGYRRLADAQDVCRA